MNKENLLILFIFGLLLTGMALKKQYPTKQAVEMIYERCPTNILEPSKDSIGAINLKYRIMEWISTKEKEPKRGDKVLLTDGLKVVIGKIGLFNIYWTGFKLHDVTHWKPLDNPPKEQFISL